MTRRALNSLRGSVPSGTSSTRGCTPRRARSRSRIVAWIASRRSAWVGAYSACPSNSSLASRREVITRNAHLRVDEVLPEVHARAVTALGAGHPRRHLGHAAHVDADAVECLLDPALGRRDGRARLAREEEDAEAEASRVDPLAPRGLGEVQRVRRR